MKKNPEQGYNKKKKPRGFGSMALSSNSVGFSKANEHEKQR